MSSPNAEDGRMAAAQLQSATSRPSGKKPKRPMTAYNFFYRDERARIMSGAAGQEQHQQPGQSRGQGQASVIGTTATSSTTSVSSSSKKRRRVEEGASGGSTVVTATATVTDVSTSNADASSSGKGDTSTTASESDKSKSGGDAHPTNSASMSTPLPPHLQSLQQAGTSDEAIAALVEHQSSFRDTSREIAKRWKAIGVSDFDRYQQLAKRDAERYKRELAEYEAERKRREAIVDKVNAASASSSAASAPASAQTEPACAPSSINTSTTSTNNAPSLEIDLPPSQLPWSNPYQPQGQQPQVEGLYQQNTAAHEISLPFSARTPAASAQMPLSSTNNFDGEIQPIITQLLQNQVQLLSAQPPTLQAQQLLGQLATLMRPHRAPAPPQVQQQQASGICRQMPVQEQMGPGGSANGSEQNKIVQMLLQQNQRLQMEVQNLRYSEEMQKQLIERQSRQLQEQQRACNQSLSSVNGGVVSLTPSGSSTSNGPAESNLADSSKANPSPLPTSNGIARQQQSSAKRKLSSIDVKSEKSSQSKDTTKAPSKKKFKRRTKAQKGGESDDDSASVDEASKGLLSLRSRASGSSDTGLSSLSTLTSIKAKPLEATGKKEEMSDISTSASDARKPNAEYSSDTGSSSNNGSQSKAKAKNNSAEDVVSDVSSSGESDDNPKKSPRKEGSSRESPTASSNGDSSSSGSSSPRSAGVSGNTEGAKTSANTPAVEAPPTKKVRVVEPTSSKRVTRSSGSDSGDFSSESSWGGNEDSSNGPTSDSSRKRKAGILKADRVYTSEMSSVSVSGSDNISAQGSDDDKVQPSGN